MVPLPDEIAERLDSPGDAIGKMLARGGKLYYLNPTSQIAGAAASLGGGEDDVARQQLVVGVIGEAQQNVLKSHPVVTAPRMLYPFPPQFQIDISGNQRPVLMTPYTWEFKSSTGDAPVYDSGSITGGDL